MPNGIGVREATTRCRFAGAVRTRPSISLVGGCNRIDLVQVVQDEDQVAVEVAARGRRPGERRTRALGSAARRRHPGRAGSAVRPGWLRGAGTWRRRRLHQTGHHRCERRVLGTDRVPGAWRSGGPRSSAASTCRTRHPPRPSAAAAAPPRPATPPAGPPHRPRHGFHRPRTSSPDSPNRTAPQHSRPQPC